MELIDLKNKIIQSFEGEKQELEKIIQEIEKDHSVYPFNEYEHLTCLLIENKGLTYEKYLEIRTDYINSNPNLWIFEISAPRTFWESFAQTYIQAKSKNLQKPNKKLDKNYSGDYDLWFEGIKIEVKASRVVDSESTEPLYIKALSRNTHRPFLMNFQQLKPQYCDIFIWLAVFRDDIVIWIMNSNEVLNHKDYSKGQHRGNSGNEGQLHINERNIQSLKKYELEDNNIEEAIRRAFKRI